MNEEITKSKLTVKQRLFLHHYLGDCNFNAARAAKSAGYAGNENSWRQTGYDVLTNTYVQAELREALKDCMTPAEITKRFTDVGRGSLDDFVDIDEDGRVTINLKKAKDRHLLHTFKGTKYSDKGRLIVERYDAMDAMERLARIYRMFGEQQIEIDMRQLNIIIEALPNDLRDDVVRALEADIYEE